MGVSKHIKNLEIFVQNVIFSAIILEKPLDSGAKRRTFGEVVSKEDVAARPGREDALVYECLAVEEGVFELPRRIDNQRSDAGLVVVDRL